MVSIDSTTPAQAAAGVLVGAPLSVHYTVSIGTYESSTSSVSCGGTGIAGAFVVNTFTPAASLPNDTNCTFSGTVTAKGENGGKSASQTWSIAFTAEAAPVYKYARFDLVIFADQHATIGKIEGETVTPLGNASEFTGNAGFPLVLCMLWDKILADGRPLASCVTPLAGSTRRNLPINPLTGELMKEYTGAVPTGAVLHDVGYGTFGDTPYAKFGVSNKGRYLDVPGVGTYYITDTDSVNLRLTKDGFATNKIIHVGDHQFLATYSNP